MAKVEVLTRTETDEYACCYRIEGGEPQGMEPGARPVGTTITVNDLFYNTPARMKFLKRTPAREPSSLRPSCTLHSPTRRSASALRDGKSSFDPGDGDLRSTVYAVLGREFARDLLPVDGGSELYKGHRPGHAARACRASRGAQHFFVNGRYVKNRTMMAALENAYKGTMMQGKFPGAVLMLEMPADLVDVNVHPAKTEIRFAKESDVFDAVYRAVRTALATPGSGSAALRWATPPPRPNRPPCSPLPRRHLPHSTARHPIKPLHNAVSGRVPRSGGPGSRHPGQRSSRLDGGGQPEARLQNLGRRCASAFAGPAAPPGGSPGPSESVLDILPEPEGEPAQSAALQQEVPAQTTPKPEAEAPVRKSRTMSSTTPTP